MIIGVDPGKNGGIVYIDDASRLQYTIMPDFDSARWSALSGYFLGQYATVYLEDVHSIYGSSAKSNFQFGRAVGFIEGFFLPLGIEIVKVKPKEWQAVMFQGVENIKKPNSKRNDTKAMALKSLEQARPDWVDLFKITKLGNKSKNVHDGLVDAALIMLYGLKQ